MSAYKLWTWGESSGLPVCIFHEEGQHHAPCLLAQLRRNAVMVPPPQIQGGPGRFIKVLTRRIVA